MVGVRPARRSRRRAPMRGAADARGCRLAGAADARHGAGSRSAWPHEARRVRRSLPRQVAEKVSDLARRHQADCASAFAGRHAGDRLDAHTWIGWPSADRVEQDRAAADPVTLLVAVGAIAPCADEQYRLRAHPRWAVGVRHRHLLAGASRPGCRFSSMTAGLLAHDACVRVALRILGYPPSRTISVQ
jgi:hypothetical protein